MTATRTTAQEAAKGSEPSGARNVDRFLTRKDEQPGFRPEGDASTVVGVDGFANYAPDLPQATPATARERVRLVHHSADRCRP